jgi:hypothetical protein
MKREIGREKEGERERNRIHGRSRIEQIKIGVLFIRTSFVRYKG